MATFTYDASQYLLIVGGFPISGFQDGSDITLEMDSETFTKQVDIDGQNVVFNKTNNYMATLTFTLNFGTADNDFLSGIYLAFRNTSGGIVPIMLKDNNGRSVATATGTVQNMASLSGGRESAGREWVLGLGQTQIFIGGAEAVS